MPEPEAGILKLELPTPFPVGSVNAYFIDGPEPILIDAGLYYQPSLTALNKKLEEHGKRLDDVRLILLTHDHLDHSGAALYLSRQNKATISMHKKSTLLARPGQESWERVFQFLLRCGVPGELMRKAYETFSLSRYFENLEAKPYKIEWLEGGETISFNERSLEALATPGHSPDHLCFYEKATSVLFCGDMLIGHITPNPLLHLDPKDGYRRTPSLINYIDSLQKLEARKISIGYPGHGKDIGDVPGLIAANKEFIQERGKLFLAKITGGLTVPYQLALSVFGELSAGELAAIDQYLSVSETIAYLDLLERDRKISVDWEGENITFKPKNS